MGCVCCSLSSFVSIVLDAFERVSLCTVCAMLVCCLLFTVMSMLIMGIGIGFHYCTVQSAVAAMDAAAQAAGAVRSGPARRSGGLPRRFPSSGSAMGQEGSGIGTGNMSPSMRSLNRAAHKKWSHDDFMNRRGRRDFNNPPMPSNNNTINDILIGGSYMPKSQALSSNHTSFNSTFINALRANFRAFDRTTLIA